MMLTIASSCGELSCVAGDLAGFPEGVAPNGCVPGVGCMMASLL